MSQFKFSSLSTSKAVELFQQGRGSKYFVPEGFKPLLIPSNEDSNILNELIDDQQGMAIELLEDWEPQGTKLAKVIVSSKTPIRGRKKKESISHPKRPANAFILYRKHNHSEVELKHKRVCENHTSACNSIISKVIAQLWKMETCEVISSFHKLAEEEKIKHAIKFPNYKYSPRSSRRKGFSSAKTVETSSGNNF